MDHKLYILCVYVSVRSSLESENGELKSQLERLTKEVTEKYDSADSKVKDLLGQVTKINKYTEL